MQTDEWWVEVEVEARGWCQLWRGRPLQQVLASDSETFFETKLFFKTKSPPLDQVLASDFEEKNSRPIFLETWILFKRPPPATGHRI